MKKVILLCIFLSAVAIAAIAVTKILVDAKKSNPEFTTAATAGRTVTQTITATNIEKIDVEFCNVEYTVSPEVKATFVVPEVIKDSYHVTLRGTTLKVDLKDNISNINKNDARPTLTLSCPALKDIEAAGASTVTILNELIVPELEVELSGASGLKAPEISCTKFSCDASGASSIKIDRLMANKTDLEASGASSVTVDKLESTQTECDASGASKVTVSSGSAGKVELDASGASSVTCKASTIGGTADASGCSSITCPQGIRADASGMSKVKFLD